LRGPERLLSREGSVAYEVELFIRDGLSNREIQARLVGFKRGTVVREMRLLRETYGHPTPGQFKISATPQSCPVSEIKRLHVRKVPLTHIAAILRVSYREVSAAIAL
jgi:IS30 family transposase